MHKIAIRNDFLTLLYQACELLYVFESSSADIFLNSISLFIYFI